MQTSSGSVNSSLVTPCPLEKATSQVNNVVHESLVLLLFDIRLRLWYLLVVFKFAIVILNMYILPCKHFLYINIYHEIINVYQCNAHLYAVVHELLWSFVDVSCIIRFKYFLKIIHMNHKYFTRKCLCWDRIIIFLNMPFILSSSGLFWLKFDNCLPSVCQSVHLSSINCTHFLLLKTH